MGEHEDIEELCHGTLTLEPDDVVILFVKERLSEVQRKHAAQSAALAFNGRRCIVLDNSMSIGVMRHVDWLNEPEIGNKGD